MLCTFRNQLSLDLNAKYACWEIDRRTTYVGIIKRTSTIGVTVHDN
jgi:hypothetical protein